MFHDRSLLARCFRGFVLPVLEYYSAVWCSAADTYLKLPDRAVSGVRSYLGVRLSVKLLIIDLFQVCVCCTSKIRCNPMHPRNDAQPGPYVPVQVTRRALVAHRFTYALPRCRT